MIVMGLSVLGKQWGSFVPGGVKANVDGSLARTHTTPESQQLQSFLSELQIAKRYQPYWPLPRTENMGALSNRIIRLGPDCRTNVLDLSNDAGGTPTPPADSSISQKAARQITAHSFIFLGETLERRNLFPGRNV